MARYTIQMTVRPAEVVELFTIDPATKKSLEEADDLAQAASDVLFDGVDENSYATETVINEADYYNIDEFLLEVMDEDGDVVYSTEDIESIKTFPYYDEEKEEDIDAPDFTPKTPQTGDYLLKNTVLGCCNITAELDIDGEFDSSKLSFHPSANLDCQICEDDVFLSCLRYDNEEIYPEHEFEEDDIDHVYYKIMSYDGTRWNGNRWEE